MTDTHTYKTKVPGYAPAPNRYYARRGIGHAKVDVATSDWNLQKAKVPGYTQPSNKYFATRARLAYHPDNKMFVGYGLRVSGSLGSQQTAQVPPPAPKPKPSRGSLPKGF
jgi:hypothetical protein